MAILVALDVLKRATRQLLIRKCSTPPIQLIEALELFYSSTRTQTAAPKQALQQRSGRYLANQDSPTGAAGIAYPGPDQCSGGDKKSNIVLRLVGTLSQKDLLADKLQPRKALT
jgi:hypothetical protein